MSQSRHPHPGPRHRQPHPRQRGRGRRLRPRQRPQSRQSEALLPLALARARADQQDDIVELGLDGQPVRDEKRALYLERFIHAAIFEARPDIHAVVHAHAEDTLPFGIAQATPLEPVIHSGSFIGANVPVWDIADKFGDTNVLVTNMEQGRDLAKSLGGNNVALMRGHGFASAGALADRGGAHVGLSAAQRARADARQAARRRDQVSLAGRDRCPQSRLQPLFERDLARLGILGEQGRLRPHARQAGRGK